MSAVNTGEENPERQYTGLAWMANHLTQEAQPRFSFMEEKMSDFMPVVRAAAVQAEPVVLDRDASIEKACQLIQEAAGNGAKLIVFPEAFIPVYPNGILWGRGLGNFGDPRAKKAYARLWQNSVEVPSVATQRLGEAARQAEAVIVMGVNERVEKNHSLYNSLLFFGQNGSLLGVHRKLVPTNHERMIHARGDGSTLKVFDTPVGKIGGLICWENWMPLARYALYEMGEQIHVAPTADDVEMFLVNARNTAGEGRLFVISVCMVLHKSSYPTDFELDVELSESRELLEAGGSAIIGPDGEILAGPLWKDEGILYADLDLNRLAEERQLMDITGHYARPDVLRLQFDPTPKNGLEEIE